MSEHITFKTAKLAKEIGFINPTNNYYMGSGRGYFSYDAENHNREGITKEKYSAPTQSQLQKWLREAHKLHIAIYYSLVEHNYNCEIYSVDGDDSIDIIYCDTYEEALEEGLKVALSAIKPKPLSKSE